MTAEEIYIKLKDELTAENESSSSPERIFIKHEGQTICTLGMNRSHEIIFVEFKPSAKDLPIIEREPFVHPHPVEMLHDAGWRQAQLTSWEEAEKLLEIIQRSYKRKKSRPSEEAGKPSKGGKPRRPILPLRPAVSQQSSQPPAASQKPGRGAKPTRPAAKVAKVAPRPKTEAKAKPKKAAPKKPKSSKAAPSKKSKAAKVTKKKPAPAKKKKSRK